MELNMVGIDLAKESFQVHGVDRTGKVVLKRTLKRKQVVEYFVNLPKTTVCMEACGGSNYWARKFKSIGHDVKIVSAQYVKPFVKSQKNDYNDAEAIVEASSRPSMRFVSPKETWQQDIQSLHRIRQRLQSGRTALICQVRSLLLEYGIPIAEGVSEFNKNILLIIEDACNELTPQIRAAVLELYEEYKEVTKRKEKFDKILKDISAENENCKRLMQVPGVGPLTATAFVAAVGDPSHFKNGRQVAAWLGLVPRQHTTGGKAKLLGITKRGDVYLRSLLVHGGRSVAGNASRTKNKSNRDRWIEGKKQKKGTNIVAVAIANHNARVMWSMLRTGENFKSA